MNILSRPLVFLLRRLVLLWLLLVAALPGAWASEENESEEEEEVEPADAIIFPFFVLALGILSHRLLSRYLEWLPYTGFLFVLGTCMGVGVTRVSGPTNLLNSSMVNFWLPIDSELLLVSFLPGLLYHDAAGQNPHLFRVAFLQCLIFAFRAYMLYQNYW